MEKQEKWIINWAFLAPFTLVGAALDARILLEVDEEILRKVLGLLILVLLLIIVFKREVRVRKKEKGLTLPKII